jgi:C-terminal processing protease CtpA/Prc
MTRGMIVKSRLLALSISTLVAMSVGLIAPAAFAAETGADVSIDTENHTKDDSPAKNTEPDKALHERDLDQKDLEARLAEARARLEEAAHEVAELSSQMSGPLMDKFMVFDELGPADAVIGVQLDPQSGKDGARIQEVSPGGPADDAGLHVGDVITQINGKDVKGDEAARQVVHQMRKVAPESNVNLRVLRDGKSREFVVTARRGVTFLGMRQPFQVPSPPFPPGAPDVAIPNVHFKAFGPVIIRGPLGDMELATMTAQLGRYFGTDKGVLVVRAPKDFKLEDGDVILAIDGREPTSGSHATRILASYQPGEKISIRVMRQQKTVNVETTLPARREFIEPGPDAEERGGKTRMIPHNSSGATT